MRFKPTPVWCNAEEHCRIWNFKRGFRVRFPSAAEKLKRLVGRHTGIVADLSSGSVLSVWEGREKELMNRPYIVESNHENKECEGPARGSPSGERYHLKKKKKSTIHRPERGSNPGHEGPWSYYLPITPHYLTTTKNGLCIKPGPVKGLGGIALLIILHKVI